MVKNGEISLEQPPMMSTFARLQSVVRTRLETNPGSASEVVRVLGDVAARFSNNATERSPSAEQAQTVPKFTVVSVNGDQDKNAICSLLPYVLGADKALVIYPDAGVEKALVDQMIGSSTVASTIFESLGWVPRSERCRVSPAVANPLVHTNLPPHHSAQHPNLHPSILWDNEILFLKCSSVNGEKLAADFFKMPDISSLDLIIVWELWGMGRPLMDMLYNMDPRVQRVVLTTDKQLLSLPCVNQ